MGTEDLAQIFNKWSAENLVLASESLAKTFQEVLASRSKQLTTNAAVTALGKLSALTDSAKAVAAVSLLSDLGEQLCKSELKSAPQNIQHVLVDSMGRFQSASSTLLALLTVWNIAPNEVQVRLRWNGAIESCRIGLVTLQSGASRIEKAQLMDAVSILLSECVRVEKSPTELSLEGLASVV